MEKQPPFVLTPVPLEELLKQIREVVQQEIKAEHAKEISEKLLSPADTCRLFQPAISLPSLAKWTKDGHLKRYDIGGRVYYRYSEVIEAAKVLKKYKNGKL